MLELRRAFKCQLNQAMQPRAHGERVALGAAETLRHAWRNPTPRAGARPRFPSILKAPLCLPHPGKYRVAVQFLEDRLGVDLLQACATRALGHRGRFG